jgi:hypothetical protein
LPPNGGGGGGKKQAHHKRVIFYCYKSKNLKIKLKSQFLAVCNEYGHQPDCMQDKKICKTTVHDMISSRGTKKILKFMNTVVFACACNCTTVLFHMHQITHPHTFKPSCAKIKCLVYTEKDRNLNGHHYFACTWKQLYVISLF